MGNTRPLTASRPRTDSCGEQGAGLFVRADGQRWLAVLAAERFLELLRTATLAVARIAAEGSSVSKIRRVTSE